jgi:hypothetical protein
MKSYNLFIPLGWEGFKGRNGSEDDARPLRITSGAALAGRDETTILNQAAF